MGQLRFVHWTDRLRTVRRRFGSRPALLFLLDRVLARLVRLEVSRVVWLDAASVRVRPADAPRFEFRFLSASEVERFAREPEYLLNPVMADRIRRGHDFCYGALAPDGRLAAYGWYALRAIEPEHSAGAGMILPDHVAYMYNGYTHPDFRGLHLHGAGMGGALHALDRRGVRALISIVHWTNFASLRSCERLGYAGIGRLTSYRLLGRRRLRVPAAAAVHGVRIGAYRVPAPVPEPTLAA